MKWAIIAAWHRFKEVRHQQKVHGYDGPLVVYAAFYAEYEDWRNAFSKCDFPPPENAIVKYITVRHGWGPREETGE